MSKFYKNIKILSTPTDLDDAIKLKNLKDELYLEKQRVVVDVPEHYELASVQDGSVGLIIVTDGTLVDANTEVELSTVTGKILDTDIHVYAVGEYVELIPAVTHDETFIDNKYMPKEDTYTKTEVDKKLVEIASGGLQPWELTEYQDYWDNLVVSATGYVENP